MALAMNSCQARLRVAENEELSRSGLAKGRGLERNAQLRHRRREQQCEVALAAKPKYITIVQRDLVSELRPSLHAAEVDPDDSARSVS